jgi:hypothetical protein
MGKNRTGVELLDTPLAVRVPLSVAVQWRASAAAAGLSLADWLRHAVDPTQVKVVGRQSPRRRPKLTPTNVGDQALIFEIAKIGNNLNQIARWVNTYRSTVDSVQVLVALSAIERQLGIALHSATKNQKQGVQNA